MCDVKKEIGGFKQDDGRDAGRGGTVGTLKCVIKLNKTLEIALRVLFVVVNTIVGSTCPA